MTEIPTPEPEADPVSPVRLSHDEAEALLAFLKYHEDEIIDGGWDLVEDVISALLDAGHVG